MGRRSVEMAFASASNSTASSSRRTQWRDHWCTTVVGPNRLADVVQHFLRSGSSPPATGAMPPMHRSRSIPFTMFHYVVARPDHR